MDLSGTFAALAHPARRHILAQLVAGETPVKDLALSLRISGPALTKHLHVLEKAGLITRSRNAQRRPCRLRAAPLKDLDEWMQTYRQFWSESFDRLDEHLKQVQQSRKTGKNR